MARRLRAGALAVWVAAAAAVGVEGAWAQTSADTLAVRPVPALAPLDEAPAAPGVPLDLAIARRARAAGVQGSALARGVATVVEFAAFPGALLLAGTLYGIGELDDRPEARDLGLRTGAAVIAAGGVSLVGKIALGRARPAASPDDPYQVEFGRGLSNDAFQSFPSAHTAMAFASAVVLSADLAHRDAGSAPWLIPGVYGAATLTGLSRIFHDEHWTSDVVAGALVGVLSGWAVWEVGGPE